MPVPRGSWSKKRLFSGWILLIPLLLGISLPGVAQLLYESEYPTIDYAGAELTDPVSRLQQRIAAGEVQFVYNGERGYLDSLLRALEIDPSSQVLVFSKTSVKRRLITAARPRALYFNDDVYVGFVQESSSLEIAAMDSGVGPVFFDLPQEAGGEVTFGRGMGRCLRCHDSYSLTGGGVPRFMMSSNLAGPEGEIVTHEVSEITDTSTPIRRRWGGWYVSGTHGSMQHLGNLVVTDIAMLSDLDLAPTGNKTSLEGLVNLDPYPVPSSDIVALLVLEHQVEVQNLMTRVSYDARTSLDKGELSAARLAEIAEPLVRSLLMADKAPLLDEVRGTSGFAEYFQSLGPRDSQGRSLRELDLKTRTFKYPLSYLVYSDAFKALPEPVRDYVGGRINAVLTGADASGDFAHISTDDGAAILAILRETAPSILERGLAASN